MKTFFISPINPASAFLLIFFLFICKPVSAQMCEDYFKLTNTYCESSSGGAYGSGSSTIYTFTIKFKKDVKIYFDTIWFGDIPKPAYFNDKAAVIRGKFNKGDSILLTVSFYYPGERDMFYNSDILLKEKIDKNPQPQINCIALLQFYVNNVKYYYAVKKIDQMKYNALP